MSIFPPSSLLSYRISLDRHCSLSSTKQWQFRRYRSNFGPVSSRTTRIFRGTSGALLKFDAVRRRGLVVVDIMDSRRSREAKSIGGRFSDDGFERSEFLPLLTLQELMDRHRSRSQCRGTTSCSSWAQSLEWSHQAGMNAEWAFRFTSPLAYTDNARSILQPFSSIEVTIISELVSPANRVYGDSNSLPSSIVLLTNSNFLQCSSGTKSSASSDSP